MGFDPQMSCPSWTGLTTCSLMTWSNASEFSLIQIVHFGELLCFITFSLKPLLITVRLIEFEDNFAKGDPINCLV